MPINFNRQRLRQYIDRGVVRRTLRLCGYVLTIGLIAFSAAAHARSNLVLWGHGDATVVSPWGYEGNDDKRVYHLRLGKNVHRVFDCKTPDDFRAMLGASGVALLQIDVETAIGRHNEHAATAAQKVVLASDLSCDPVNYASLDPDDPVFIEDNETYYLPSGNDGEYYKIAAACAYGLTADVFKSVRWNQKIGKPTSGTTTIELSCAEDTHLDRSYRLFGIERVSTSGETVFELALSAFTNSKKNWSSLRICHVDGTKLAALEEAKFSKLVSNLRADFNISAPILPLPSSSVHMATDCLDVCIDDCGNPTVDANSVVQAIGANGLELHSLGAKRDLWLDNCQAFTRKYTGLASDRVEPSAWREGLNRFEVHFRNKNPEEDERVFKCPGQVCQGNLNRSNYTRQELDNLIRGYAIDVGSTGDPACTIGDDGKVAAPLELRIDRPVTITADDEYIAIGNRLSNSPFDQVVLKGLGGDKQTLILDFECNAEATENCPETITSQSFFEVRNDRKLTLQNLNIQVGENWQPEADSRGKMRAFVVGGNATLVLDGSTFEKGSSVHTGIQINSNASVYCRGCSFAGSQFGIKFGGTNNGRIAILGTDLERASVSSDGTALSLAAAATTVVSHADVTGKILAIVPAGRTLDTNATRFIVSENLDNGHAFRVRRNGSEIGKLSINCRGMTENCKIEGLKRGSNFSFLKGTGAIIIDPRVSFKDDIDVIRDGALATYLKCQPETATGPLGTIHYRGRQYCK